MLQGQFDFPYFVGVLILGVVWFSFFHIRSLRKEMIIVGIPFCIAAVLIGKFYALLDYWHPPYIFSSNFPLEDFLYGFFIAGLLAVVHDLIHKPIRYKKEKSHLVIFIFAPVALTVLLFYLLVNVLG